MIVRCNIGLKTLLGQGVSGPVYFGGLVSGFKRGFGGPDFGDRLGEIMRRCMGVGYNLDVMQQSACLVLSPVAIYSYGFLFNCTTVGQASDSMTALA